MAWLQVPAEGFDVVIEPEVPKAAASSVKRARKLRATSTALVRSGLTVHDAGALLGLSYQRVGHLVGHR